jgi:uncharacterized delta-60 repeat protein
MPSQLQRLGSFRLLAWLGFAWAVLAGLHPALHAQQSWGVVPPVTTTNLWSVAYGPAPKLFVAVGENGVILTSPDGLTWTNRASPTTRWLTSVTYAAGQFLAVGDAGILLKSTDGITWIVRSAASGMPVPSRLNAIAYGNGIYVNVSESGEVFTSPDSDQWARARPLFRARGLTFGYGNFVVTGDGGRLAHGSTGTEYSSDTLGSSDFIESVLYARRTFVAVGARGLILTSPDAEKWTGRPSGTTATLRGLSFFNHHFVAVGEGGTVLVSPDGLTWTQRPLPSAPLFTAVAAGDNRVVAVGHQGAVAISFKSDILPAPPPTTPPTIVTPPRDITEAADSNVLFSVVAIAPDTIAYQWSFNGQPISGATSDTLVVKNVRATQAGRYSVAVSHAPGDPSALTRVAEATLTVIPAFAAPSPLVDPTFAVTPALTSDAVTAVEQPDGKVILGGGFITLVNGVGQTGLVRLAPDGSVDSTFRPGTGVAGPGVPLVTALALQPDGKVLIGGEFTLVDGTPRPNLARLLSTGALDPGFVPPTTLSADPITQLVAQSDGKVLLINRANQLLRLNADGSLDSGFRLPPPNLFPTRVALTGTGKILVAGGVPGGNTTVARFNSDGTVDSSFTTTTLAGTVAVYLRVLTDDRFVVGTQYAVTIGTWGLYRFNADGSRDLTFPTLGGSLSRNSATFASDATGRITYQVSNSLASSTGGKALARLNRDGSIDATFRPSVTAPTPIAGLNAIVPLASGQQLLLGSFTSVDGTPRARVARLVPSNAPALNPPAVAAASPQTITVTAGEPATLRLTPAGTAPFTVTWNVSNLAFGVPTTDGMEYNLSAQQTALYTATLTNPAGSITSQAFYVVVEPSAPRIHTPPAHLSVNTGRTAVFITDIRGSEPLIYQWFFNNTPIGSSTPTLTLTNVTAANAGSYTVVIRNSLGSITTSAVRLTVDDTSRLANLATRGLVGSGENVLTTGFVLSGPVPRSVLIRGIGPGLAPFGLTDLIGDPKITLFDASGIKLAENDNWGDPSSGATAALFRQWGAFDLLTGSIDAALVRTLPPGAYTVQVSASPASAHLIGPSTGLALAEIYEADTQPTRLANLSSRLVVGAGASVAIPGLFVSGVVPRKLLIRAVGPSLARFGVGGFLPDPTLTLTTPDGRVIAVNRDWAESDGEAARLAATQVGAFPLDAGSKDAVLLVTLSPGNYTAQVSGADNISGVVLVEIYEAP